MAFTNIALWYDCGMIFWDMLNLLI